MRVWLPVADAIDTYLLWEDLSKAEGTEYSFPVQYSNGTIVSVNANGILGTMLTTRHRIPVFRLSAAVRCGLTR